MAALGSSLEDFGGRGAGARAAGNMAMSSVGGSLLLVEGLSPTLDIGAEL